MKAAKMRKQMLDVGCQTNALTGICHLFFYRMRTMKVTVPEAFAGMVVNCHLT